jgi:predicted ATP-dependent endonuclease of OLD family
MSGFQFRSLQLTGPGLSPARVEFRAGLNVISGASNAGKSFIFNALDFACGAAGPLGRIPESDGYNEVEVVIEDSEGIQFSLRRSSAGGGYHLVNLNEPELQPIILGERFNRSDPNNISSFLLKLTGLEGKKVRKNAENELQDLSFRNLSHLISLMKKRS